MLFMKREASEKIQVTGVLSRAVLRVVSGRKYLEFPHRAVTDLHDP